MKTFKIYNVAYPLAESTSEPYDCYGYKNQLVDDLPKGKMVGYVRMEDGSVVECYKKFNMAIILIPMLLAILTLIGIVIYLFYFQPKDVKLPGNIVKVGEDVNIVTYNGYMAVHDGNLSIKFTNGDYPCTVQVVGEGLESKPTNLGPGEYLETVPAQFVTEDGVIEATIVITTETSKQEFPVIVEVPDNLNGNDSLQGLEGYFEGEEIYGVQPVE